MATKFDRFGPARGVNYFSTGDLPEPGPQNLVVEGPLQPVVRPTEGGDRFEPSERRDLQTDPLSAAEARGLKGVQGAMNMFGLPGIAMNSAVDYNLGVMNSNQKTDTEVGGLTNRNSMGYYAGIASGQGMSPVEAMQFAGQQRLSDLGSSFGMGTPNDVPVEDRSGTPVGLSGPTTDPNQAMVDSLTNAGYYTGGSGDFGATTDVSNGYGGVDSGSYSGDGSGGYYADGGPVGMSAPSYSAGTFMGQSPTSLTTMGFADGGGVGMQTPAGGNTPEMVTMRVAEMMRNPQIQQAVQQVVGSAMQSGELTPQELVMLGRIAEASIHNPALYPKLRQFAMQQGLAPLPASFDQRIIMVLMVASKMMGQGGGQPTQPGQVPPTDQAQMENPTGMANGGMLRGPGTGRSDSIGTVNESTGQPVKVANGEYVIPAHVVKAKGQEFFDKMLRQYAPLTPSEG